MLFRSPQSPAPGEIFSVELFGMIMGCHFFLNLAPSLARSIPKENVEQNEWVASQFAAGMEAGREVMFAKSGGFMPLAKRQFRAGSSRKQD